ncbi:unnamed protein product [Oppiella nova]|uniref:DNA polymerase alpha subunit B n=1 Tax=Oppiella nova TaxID=334625 RepID=A0A7R9M7Z9_9ACAR|nr:unnamed protein product [Oppiella nova]CAG2172331.1 unnamed protein product [Oppiella nova]
MVSLICDQKLRDELSDFYHTVADEVVDKLKDLCVIHDISEEAVCAELLAFVMKYDKKELTIDVVDDFQTDYLDKKAINEYKKSKTLAAKVNRTPKASTSKSAFNANQSFKALITEMSDKLGDNNRPTTQIEVVANDESITEDPEVIDVDSQEAADAPKTPEKSVDQTMEYMDVSAMTTPAVTTASDESINTSLKIDETINTNTLCYFGNSYSDHEWRNRSKTKYTVEPYDKSITLCETYKFMSLKITETNEILNDIIDEFSELLKEKLDIESWNQFSVPSPSESYYIGRVCYDCNQKHRLSADSLRFEGSRYLTNSESIDLDLSRLSSYSLFAGQVIACKAINESGKSLIVQEIIDLDKITQSPAVVPTFSQPLHLMVGVGPFNSHQSLDWEPLKKLMEKVKKYEPDFCILLGPFVDTMNEKLLTTDEPIDRYFNSQMRYISEELQDLKTEAIVIPSTRDLNVFNIMPTMAFNSYKSHKIHYFSNPCVLNISGVVIAMTSTDVLLHLSKEEISAGQNIERLSRLCKHIVNQRNFYPIFPPNPDVNVEFTKYDFLRLPVSPHLLILPSDLKEFVKNISRAVVINTGRLSKSKYTRIRVDPIDQKSFNGSLESYTNVEIIKMKD